MAAASVIKMRGLPRVIILLATVICSVSTANAEDDYARLTAVQLETFAKGDATETATQMISQLEHRLARRKAHAYASLNESLIAEASLAFQHLLATDGYLADRRAAQTPPKLSSPKHQEAMIRLLALLDAYTKEQFVAVIGYSTSDTGMSYLTNHFHFASSNHFALYHRYGDSYWRTVTTYLKKSPRQTRNFLSHWAMSERKTIPTGTEKLDAKTKEELQKILLDGCEQEQQLQETNWGCGNWAIGSPKRLSDWIKAHFEGATFVQNELAHLIEQKAPPESLPWLHVLDLSKRVPASDPKLPAMLKQLTATAEHLSKHFESDAKATSSLHNKLLEIRNWLAAHHPTAQVALIESTMNELFTPVRMRALDLSPAEPELEAKDRQWQRFIQRPEREAYWNQKKQRQENEWFNEKYPTYKGVDHTSSILRSGGNGQVVSHALMPLDGFPLSTDSNDVVASHPHQVLEYPDSTVLLTGREGWKQFPQRIRSGQTIILESMMNVKHALHALCVGSGKFIHGDQASTPSRLEITFNEQQIWHRPVPSHPFKLSTPQAWSTDMKGRFSFRNHGPNAIAFDSIWFEDPILRQPPQLTFWPLRTYPMQIDDISKTTTIGPSQNPFETTQDPFANTKDPFAKPNNNPFVRFDNPFTSHGIGSPNSWRTNINDLASIPAHHFFTSWRQDKRVPAPVAANCLTTNLTHWKTEPAVAHHALHQMLGWYETGGTELAISSLNTTTPPAPSDIAWLRDFQALFRGKASTQLPVMLVSLNGEPLTGVHSFGRQSNNDLTVWVSSYGPEAYKGPIRIAIPYTPRDGRYKKPVAQVQESAAKDFFAPRSPSHTEHASLQKVDLIEIGDLSLPRYLHAIVHLRDVTILKLDMQKMLSR